MSRGLEWGDVLQSFGTSPEVSIRPDARHCLLATSTMTAPAYNEPSVVADGFLATAFRRLREGLIPFMRENLGDEVAYGPEDNRRKVTLERERDVGVLLSAWLGHQSDLAGGFSERPDFDYGRHWNPVQNWPEAILAFRNARWSHQGVYNDDDVVNVIDAMRELLVAVGAEEQAAVMEQIANEIEGLIYSIRQSGETVFANGQGLTIAEVAAGQNINALLFQRSQSEEPGVFADGFLTRAWRRLAEGLGPYWEKVTEQRLSDPRDVAAILEPEKFGRRIKNQCYELRGHRNNWAHNGKYGRRSVFRILRLIRDVLKAVNAEESADAVDRMLDELRRLDHTSGGQHIVHLGADDGTTVEETFYFIPIDAIQSESTLADFARFEAIGDYVDRDAPTMPPVEFADADVADRSAEINLLAVIAECDEAIRRNPSDAAAYIRRGRARGDLGDFAGSVDDISRAKRIDSRIEWEIEQANDYWARGNTAFDNDDYVSAIRNYGVAIGFDPQFASAYNNRALAHVNRGDYTRAIEDWTEVIRLNPQDADAYYDRSRAYKDSGDYQRAISDCTEAIRLDPQNAYAFSNRGIAYIHTGDFELSIRDFTEAIRLAPGYAAAYNNRGSSYTYSGQDHLALDDFTSAINLDPLYCDPYVNRGNIYLRLDEYLLAIDDLNEAIRLNPSSAKAYEIRGLAYSHTNEHQLAIDDFTEAIHHNAQDAELYLKRGIIYKTTGYDEQAIADYTEAIRLNPYLGDAYCSRGNARVSSGDYEYAIVDYTEALSLGPDDYVFYYNRGVAYWRINEIERAITDYTEAIRLNAQFADAYNNRGSAYLHRGDSYLAIADYTEAISLEPQYAGVYYNRSVARFGVGDYARSITDIEQAIHIDIDDTTQREGFREFRELIIRYRDGFAEYDRAIAENPDDPDGWHLRGLHYFGLEDYRRAIDDFDEALQRDNDNAEVWNDRGLAYYNLGDDTQAIADYSRAIVANPDFPQAYYNRGLSWRRQGELDGAVDDFTAAVERRPDYALAYQQRGLCYRLRGERDLELAQADFARARELEREL